MSKRVKAKNNPYSSALEFISSYSGKVNSIQSSLLYLDKPFFQNSIVNSIEGFQKQFSAFNDYKKMLPSIDHLDGLGHLADLTRSTTLALSSFKPPIIAGIAKAFTNQLETGGGPRIIEGALLSNSYFKGLPSTAIAGSLASLAKSNDIFTFGLQSSLVKATELNLLAERSLSSFDWSNLGLRIGVSHAERTSLQNSFSSFSNGFSSLLKTYEKESSIIEANPAFLKIP